MCVVWCCCCKSMPSYFLIPSIAVLFCYWHQTPPATPLLCCLSPRPAAQTKQQQPPQQARSRQQPAGQHAAIYRASSAVRLRGFVAPSSAGLDRAVAVSVAGAVVVRQPAVVPKHDDGKLRRAAEYFFGRLAGRSGCMRTTRRERKEAPIRVFDRFSQSLVVARSCSSLGVGRSQRPGES